MISTIWHVLTRACSNYKHLQKGVAKKTATYYRTIEYRIIILDKNISYHIACLNNECAKISIIINTSCLGHRDKYLSWTFARINV